MDENEPLLKSGEESEVVNMVAEEFVRDSVTRPSPRFGSLVLEVDQATLGKKAASFRLKKKVKAIRVAEEMGISRSGVCLLESGTLFWDMLTLKKYLRTVERLAERNSKTAS